jgi:hypothetical protein
MPSQHHHHVLWKNKYVNYVKQQSLTTDRHWSTGLYGQTYDCTGARKHTQLETASTHTHRFQTHNTDCSHAPFEAITFHAFPSTTMADSKYSTNIEDRDYNRFEHTGQDCKAWQARYRLDRRCQKATNSSRQSRHQVPTAQSP